MLYLGKGKNHMISRSKQAVQSATTLQLSPEEDRHARMVKYVVAMSTRTVCFVLAIFVPRVGTLDLWTCSNGAALLRSRGCQRRSNGCAAAGGSHTANQGDRSSLSNI